MKLWGQKPVEIAENFRIFMKNWNFAYKFFIFFKFRSCILWHFLRSFTWNFQNSKILLISKVMYKKLPKKSKFPLLQKLLSFSNFLGYWPENLIQQFYQVLPSSLKIWAPYLACILRYKPSKSVMAGPGRAGSRRGECIDLPTDSVGAPFAKRSRLRRLRFASLAIIIAIGSLDSLGYVQVSLHFIFDHPS